MNVVVLRGSLSSSPVVRSLASGSVLVSLELTTTVEGANVSVPVAWFDPPGDVEWDTGDQLLVTGTVRRRFFRAGGVTSSRTEVVATEVIPASSGRRARAALSRASARIE